MFVCMRDWWLGRLSWLTFKSFKSVVPCVRVYVYLRFTLVAIRTRAPNSFPNYIHLPTTISTSFSLVCFSLASFYCPPIPRSQFAYTGRCAPCKWTPPAYRRPARRMIAVRCRASSWCAKRISAWSTTRSRNPIRNASSSPSKRSKRTRAIGPTGPSSSPRSTIWPNRRCKSRRAHSASCAPLRCRRAAPKRRWTARRWICSGAICRPHRITGPAAARAAAAAAPAAAQAVSRPPSAVVRRFDSSRNRGTSVLPPSPVDRPPHRALCPPHDPFNRNRTSTTACTPPTPPPLRSPRRLRAGPPAPARRCNGAPPRSHSRRCSCAKPHRPAAQTLSATACGRTTNSGCGTVAHRCASTASCAASPRSGRVWLRPAARPPIGITRRTVRTFSARGAPRRPCRWRAPNRRSTGTMRAWIMCLDASRPRWRPDTLRRWCGATVASWASEWRGIGEILLFFYLFIFIMLC